MELCAFTFVLGFLVSILSGLLGIGGGIVLAPVLLYVPALIGLPYLTMAEISGLTITQGLFASLVATRAHDKHRNVNHNLVIWMGATIALTALFGSLVSRFLSHETLMVIFSILVVSAALLMLLKKHGDDEVDDGRTLTFNIPAAVAIAGVIGLLGGMVGQGGSFILIPLMLHVLKLPTRVVIGSNLAIVFISSIAGFVGKLATEQIPLLPALFLVVGAIFGAKIGSSLSHRTRPVWLARTLACVVALAAVGIGVDTLVF
ncbi:MAG: sulfite exporter TauE/SafE family protein [Proteobacteria bacterium]|nr:sulfite exporter TauE/SafE family protein [Pseudomonadota bacterium]